jgi:hypothetical protein
MEDMRTTAIEDFFRLFTHHTNQGDIPAQVGQFAASFLAAGPQGANCVRRDDFALFVPQRKRLFESAGLRSTELARIQTEALDARFCSARTWWKMVFASGTPAPQEILVESTYIVDTGIEPFQIVFYLAHQDIMAILKERGILAASAI